MSNNYTAKKIDQLDAIVSECRRFIETVKQYTRRLKKDNAALYGCKESATCKRASMDLSNMLVKLRRG